MISPRSSPDRGPEPPPPAAVPDSNRTADSPEFQILLAAARAALGLHPPDRLRALLSQPVDWDRFRELARRHSAAPLVFSFLSANFTGLIPEPILDNMRSQQKLVLSRNLQLMAGLIQTADLFERHRTPVLAYKGPLLAAAVYGDLSHRSSVDIDLLIQPSHVDRAAGFLTAAGYTMSSPMAWKQRNSASASPELLFTRPDESVEIDLHWSFVPNYYPFPLDPAPLWRRAATVNAGGRKLPTFSPEDLLLVLCVHGAKHLWNRLRWICDIAKLVQTGLDWDLALQHAREQRCERTLLIGAAMAHEVLGAPLPADILARIHRDRSLPPAVAALKHRLFTAESILPTGWEFCRYVAHFAPNWRVKLRFWLGVVAVPREADSAAVNLPGFLGAPLRLARLAVKHLAKLPRGG